MELTGSQEDISKDMKLLCETNMMNVSMENNESYIVIWATMKEDCPFILCSVLNSEELNPVYFNVFIGLMFSLALAFQYAYG